MEKVNLTPRQQEAVEARGKTLVSASAGSGKTKVMVERYVALVKAGAEVSEMLAVTFTNKAAREMRGRIRKALTEAVSAAAGEMREHLKRQLYMLPLADICTIHAFCGRLIRTYFYLADVDPAFRIVGPDDAECRALSSRALDQTFEEAYGQADPAFSALLAVYFRKKKDKRLKEIVLSLYAIARGEPDYRRVLEEAASDTAERFAKAEMSLAEDYKRRAERALEALSALEMQLDSPAWNKLYALEKLKDYARELRGAAASLAAAQGVFAMKTTVCKLPSKPRKTPKTGPEFCDFADRLKAVSDVIKSVYDELGAYHVRDEEFERCEKAAEKGAMLARLALAYDAQFSAAKRDAGVLDYSDLEHIALTVLKDREGEDLKSRYRYLFVDEYQDVNPMQERILTTLAGEECDVFLVGDPKQAIYGFRGSRSKYFEEKGKEYRASGGNCIDLDMNFRSSDAVLDCTNFVFREVFPPLHKEYADAVGTGKAGGVTLVPLSAGETSAAEKGERGVYSVKRAAAHSPENAIAKKVLELVLAECGRAPGLGREFFDAELKRPDGAKGGMRKVRFGDVAVLVRKNSASAGDISRLLAQNGIPVTTSAEINVCEQFEGRLLLDWLSFLDNAEQDIPMAAAMLSVIGGFDERELARIRLFADQAFRGLTFRAACRVYAAKAQDGLAEKLKNFQRQAEKYRAFACVKSAAEMLRLLLADGLEAQIAAKGASGAELRLAHVRRLIAESEGCTTVHDFLRRLKDCDFKVEYAEVGGEDAVHVMTMHASKGLEFPIVILTELDAAFHGPDRDDVMWTEDYRLAPRYYDEETRKYGETLIRRAAALTMRREEVEGECNLLYVAMTRARARLYLLAEKAEGEREYAPAEAKRLSDFLPQGLPEKETAPPAPQTAEEPLRRRHFRTDAKHMEELIAACAPYPFEKSATRVPVKSSATALLETDGVPMYEYGRSEEEGTMPESDLFDADMGGSFSPEDGTAYHAFLQHVDFTKSAAEELVRMTEGGVLPAEQIERLNLTHLSKILSLPVFGAVRGKRLWREQKFLVKLPASLFPERYGGADDEIVFQGAIDLLIEEGGGKFTVIDYKLSRLSSEDIRARYAVQLKLYRAAVAKVMGREMDDVSVFIVNLARGSVIPM